MQKKYEPINKKFPHIIHGADYNPEQWRRTPEIWDEDMRLMKLANMNSASIGMFSWVTLEREEGVFNFGVFDTIMDKLAKNGESIVLATPSGAKPAWMSQKYPEILRVEEDRVRNLHGGRHNHCYTSPVYREKVRIINTKLAERYANHPALLAWHVSNEYGGECHCDYCQNAFREWLKKKYDNDLDKLNEQWCTTFWSHEYTDWSQIESPSSHGETCVHGLTLDWKRFVTYQTLDFMKAEIEPLRKINPDIPITSNFMGAYVGLDYFKMAKALDIVSWDSYPCWHEFQGEMSDYKLASDTAFVHDLYRSLKDGKPFMLMESVPSTTNWFATPKLKKPGMHLLSSMQAVAHGADTVQYFQWRKSRGSSEKFHGAVVDHSGSPQTRVFREVAEVGEVLQKLDEVVGTTVDTEVAVIFDWENRWALSDIQGLRRGKRDYENVCKQHYHAFFKKGIPVDVIDSECDFSKYKLIVAPFLYMIKPGVTEKIENFTKNGGTFVVTYFSGIVNENDLCFLGGFPGPLRDVMGIWVEEIECLGDEESNRIVIEEDCKLKLSPNYKAKIYCDIIHAESAKVLARYGDDFYNGSPALTENSFGQGKAYYIAFRNEDEFLNDFYGELTDTLNIKRTLDTDLPQGISATSRTDGENDFVFLMNFTNSLKTVELDKKTYIDVLTNTYVSGVITLEEYGVKILKRPCGK